MPILKSCPLCQHPAFHPFSSTNDQGYQVNYVICRTCGLVMQNPRMEEDELAAFYAGAYRQHQQSTEMPIEKDLLMQDARAVSTLQLLKSRLPIIKRHLDIGSSSGALMREVRRHYQCESVGIEPGEAYRQYSQASGERIYPDLDSLSEAGEDRFDFISMMHVLEHIPDPVKYLTDLRETVLSVKGSILVEVPNLFDHASFELPHLYAFSGNSLRDVLRQAGYQVTWMRKHGSFRSPILRLYITALGRSTGQSQPPRRWYFPGATGVALRRRIGNWKRGFFSARWPDWSWQSPETVLPSRDRTHASEEALDEYLPLPGEVDAREE